MNSKHGSWPGKIHCVDKLVTVGDLASDEIGSGARMNSGKTAVELVPVFVWSKILAHKWPLDTLWLHQSFGYLAEFQQGQTSSIWRALEVAPSSARDACCAVFDYGRHKYAAWNWAKGMPWSVPLACAVRHVRKVVEDTEWLDSESKLPHVGHYLCNIVMLATYSEHYPAGNDLPNPKYFSGGIPNASDL